MQLTYYLALINGALCAALALVAIVRKRRSMAQWAFAAGMILFAAKNACEAWTESSVFSDEMLGAQTASHLFLAFMPGTWLLFSLTYARGNATEFLRRWKLALAASFLFPVLLLALFRDHLILFVGREYLGAPTVFELETPGVVLHGLLLISMVTITMNLERTYRTSIGTMRWRIKFMLLGLAVMNSVQFYTSSQAVLFHGGNNGLQEIQSAALLIACLCIGRSFLRPGQFSVDLHPSHTALYGSITLVLAGVYLVVVGVLARFAAFLGGDSTFPLRALVFFLGLVGLAVVLQSDRARMALRHLVSRHFQRPLFDYRTMWQRFAEGMASTTDATALSRSAVKLVSASLEIQSVSLWIVNDRRDALTLAASTLLDDQTAGGSPLEIASAGPTIAHFEAHPDPVDIEEATTPGTAELREKHVSQFPKGGHRVCIPLIARGSLAGLITLGDRVGGLPFAAHDFDMFRCIGDHVAAALLNIQLSQRLAQAREFEAFQTMATFFVHDLKNAANTLSLLLQNLPENFQDPEFLDDAMKSCGRTVDHINGLVGKLSALREGLSLTPVAADFNAIIARALDDWPSTCPLTLERDLHPLPPTSLDSDQMLKVLTNLVANAREATPAGGRVRVSSALRGRNMVVTVTDTGCGMTAEFMRRSLFRPFQTTKKRGLGIGMFQSKMIVEAHGGHIDVQSTPGKGTTFEVVLPVTAG